MSTAGAPLDDRSVQPDRPDQPDQPTQEVPVPSPTRTAPGPTRTAPHAPAVVLGLALVAVAVLVGLAVLTDVALDLRLVVPVLVAALGVLLVTGGVVAGLRRRG